MLSFVANGSFDYGIFVYACSNHPRFAILHGHASQFKRVCSLCKKTSVRGTFALYLYLAGLGWCSGRHAFEDFRACFFVDRVLHAAGFGHDGFD